jgi:hypothetical protein
VISLHAWPGGLAIVVDAHPARVAAVLGPDGWRRDAPGVVLPEGPPVGAETVTLDVPSWLAEQLASLEIALAGAHTEFVRLDRMMTRLQAERHDGALIVLGSQPVAVVLTEGAPHIVLPDVPPGSPAMPILAAAAGWIVLFSGKVARAQQRPVQPPTTDGAAHLDERFVVLPALVRAVPDDVAAEIRAAAGEPALAVIAHLDGAQSIVQIADRTGLRTDQVAQVVKVLSARKLAFRYVSRLRPPSGARTPG